MVYVFVCVDMYVFLLHFAYSQCMELFYLILPRHRAGWVENQPFLKISLGFQGHQNTVDLPHQEEKVVKNRRYFPWF